MMSVRSQTIDRRAFLTTMAATSAAAGASILFAREASAAWSSVSPGRQPGVTEARQATQSPTPTIVLVHGAFAESSSWNGVIAELLDQGFPVVAAANPLRGLSSDAAYVASILAGIPGPVVLVGHSYGGGVITNAATSNVMALVYVAGFAPDAGESSSDLTNRFPGSTLGPTLASPVTLSDGGQDLYIQQDKFHDQFAADLPIDTARLMAATQRPITMAALTDSSGTPAWKTIPSWFIYGDQDRNIPPAALAFMAGRAGAQEMIEIEGASHVVMVSHPSAVAAQIWRAATTDTSMTTA